jgi:uncharacterized protein (TIGR02145 family)
MKYISIIFPIAILLLLSGCDDDPLTPEENQSPEIQRITSNPSTSSTNRLPGDDTVQVTVVATDPDQDGLSYTWFADDGRFIGDVNESTVQWEAPIREAEDDYIIEVIVSDGALTAEGNITIYVDKATPPTVSTAEVSDITETSARGGGNVSDDGGLSVMARGVVWSTSSNPTLDSNDGYTNDGSGTGSFTSDITNLDPDTEYYVRAYATNSRGTGYGSQRSFTTTGPRDTETEVVEVTNPVTGRTWMDRNLGASRAATSSTDEEAYGHLYQWGRAADGHQVRTSDTTSTLSSSDTPGHGNFILAPSYPGWRSPQNDNLWQRVNDINNPCPSGYRLPTDSEWETERRSWSSDGSAGAFASPLKLPRAGRRNSDGSLDVVGGGGLYWSSTVSDIDSRRLLFTSSRAYVGSTDRAVGLSVRCIKD